MNKSLKQACMRLRTLNTSRTRIIYKTAYSTAGQCMIEYGILIVLMSITAIGVLTSIGSQLHFSLILTDLTINGSSGNPYGGI